MDINSIINRVVWGQCTGDVLGDFLQNKEAPLEIWRSSNITEQMPFKKGRISIFTKQMLLIMDLWKENAHCSSQEFAQLCIEKLHSHTSQTLFCRAIHNKHPFALPDIEMAARLIPLAIAIEDLPQMLDLCYDLIKIATIDPYASAGILRLLCYCWGMVHQHNMDTVLAILNTWSASKDIPPNIWWAFHQAQFILDNGFGQSEMLNFVNSLQNDGNPLQMPSTQHSLSVIPLLIHNLHSHNWQNLVFLEGDFTLLCAIQGALLAIQQDIPTWLTAPIQHLKVLQKYPIELPKSTQPRQLPLF